MVFFTDFISAQWHAQSVECVANVPGGKTPATRPPICLSGSAQCVMTDVTVYSNPVGVAGKRCPH